MTKDEALKMAIEALEEIHVGNMTPMAEINWNKAIQACKEAVEQPAQEPVAWIIQTQKIDGEPTAPYAMMGKYKYVADTCDFGEPIPLYTHPAPSWQGLSDDEIYRIYSKVQDNCVKDFPPELYAAWFKNTKEKNT